MGQLSASGGQIIGVSASASNGYSGLISFRMDWLDLLAVQETLRSLLQHHSSKASVLWHSAFFMVQFSHLYMTTGKTIALTTWTFGGKVMSLLFNMMSRFVIAFLPRSKSLLNFMAAVSVHSDLGAQENKVCHCFHLMPSRSGLTLLRWTDWPCWFDHSWELRLLSDLLHLQFCQLQTGVMVALTSLQDGDNEVTQLWPSVQPL